MGPRRPAGIELACCVDFVSQPVDLRVKFSSLSLWLVFAVCEGSLSELLGSRQRRLVARQRAIRSPRAGFYLER